MKFDFILFVVVMGGVLGLGLVMVKVLRVQGVKVVIFDFNQEIGEKMVKEIGVVFCQCDVLLDESVDQVFVSVCEVNGQEWILVCCVGGGNVIFIVCRDKKIGEI